MSARSRLATLYRRTTEFVAGDDYDRPDGRCRLGPEWLVLVVNNFCNLHCRMCDVGLKESASVFWAHMIGDDRRNMSLEMLLAILEQASAFRPRPRIGLAFTEPLIHPRIVEFCRAAVGRGFFCSITTNGFMLPQLADALVDAGLSEITISIDGPEEVHDRVRGHVGSFQRLYAGIEKVNEAKRRRRVFHPRIRFSYTITDENATTMLEFVRAVEPLQPTALCFSHLNFITSEMAAAHNAAHGGAYAVARSNLGTIEPERIDLDAMWRALGELKAYARSRPAFPALVIVPDLAARDDLDVYYREPMRFVGGRSCTDPWRMMMVRTDGTVIPAHSRCYNVPLGTIRETTLSAMWNNVQALAFRRTLKAAGGTLPACARCCGVIGKPAAPTPARALSSLVR
ncbi:MAG: radical SAM protein [Acidobacteriia bacterium]|nr:radical SAM protein [Terriglobia bacterium]